MARARLWSCSAVKLNPEATGQYGGFSSSTLRRVETLSIATAGGALTMIGPDGQPSKLKRPSPCPMAARDWLRSAVFELEPGEYVVQMSGFAGDSAPLLFGLRPAATTTTPATRTSGWTRPRPSTTWRTSAMA